MLPKKHKVSQEYHRCAHSGPGIRNLTQHGGKIGFQDPKPWHSSGFWLQAITGCAKSSLSIRRGIAFFLHTWDPRENLGQSSPQHSTMNFEKPSFLAKLCYTLYDKCMQM